MTRFDCHWLLSKLDDLIDGALDEPDAAAAWAHLDACASCRSELEQGRELEAMTRSLPRTVEPDRDLWPGIVDRIEERRVVHRDFSQHTASMRRNLYLAAAAAAVLIVSVTIAYMAGLERARPQLAEAPAVESIYTKAAYGGMANDLEQARDLLRTSLDQRRDELSTETWSVVMENMAVIDDAIERIEIALADNPNDGRLNRQLAGAYRRQIDLLQRATRLPAEV